MGLIELYAICSSILVVIVYITIISDKIRDYKYHKMVERRAKKA